MELLEVVTDGVVRTVGLTGARMTIGRSETNDVVLDGDVRASRDHALLTNVAGVWRIEDCNSTNGTYVNSVKISDRVELGIHDGINVGSSIIKLTTDTSASGLHWFGNLAVLR